MLPFALGAPEVIRPLVAAFAQCLETDSPLVLVEQDPAVASCWFAALQYLLSPAAAWSLPFDTYQDPDLVLRQPEHGSRLVAVAEVADEWVGPLVRSGRIVVSADRPASAAAATELAWSDPPYSPLQASPWAELALQLLDAGVEATTAVVATIDELSAMAGLGGRTSPMWALPTALLYLDFPLSVTHREVASQLCISLWPTAERVSAGLVQHLRGRTVEGLSRPFETFRERAEQLSATAGEADAFSDLVVGGYLTGLLGTPTPSAAGRPWLPPLRLISAPAMAELLGGLPELLAWTAELPLIEPSVAVALMTAACLVAEAAQSEQRGGAQLWLEPRIADLLEEMITHNYPGSDRLFAAMPPLPEFFWKHLLDPLLSAMLADVDVVEADPFQFSATSYVATNQDDGFYLDESGHEGWHQSAPMPRAENRPRPSPRQRPEPGSRWPAAVHEWIGAAGLDEQLAGDLGSLKLTLLLAEHAAYRNRIPILGLNPDAVLGLAFWARVRTIGPGLRAKDRVLRAAREIWLDLRKMLPIAAPVLSWLDPTVDTRALLERLLVMTPLGKATALLRTPGALVSEQPTLVGFHRAESQRMIITGPQQAHKVDTQLNEYDSWSTHLYLKERDRSAALRSSILTRTAAVHLCLDLESALSIWLRPDAKNYAVGREARLGCDFEGAWNLLLQCLEGQSPTASWPELGRVLAYLHLRSILQPMRDPARLWLVGAETVSELPMTTRLRSALSIADDEVAGTFRDEVALWTERVASQGRLIAASGATNAKEFHKVVNAATIRVFEAPKSSKFGFNRGRS
ncbi:MAG: hypothetical protein M3Y42_04665 [Actinomycetota bacterium]|nr:hypothetical protein [Actinomycetota bacterium]MDQ2956239.1 hypothetical protein [Actinomycetota bacterium]